MNSKEALEILSFTYNSPFAKVAREKLEQDLELLEKYKKAIKIINNALELYVDFYEVGVENRSSFIEYEDSELLKEVLNYE